MSKAASSEKRIVSAFIALHGTIKADIADYHQPEHTFIFNLNFGKLPPRYKLYAPDILGRLYTLTDRSASNFISEKIEEWKHSPMSSRPASPRARSVSSGARSASPRARPESFSEFVVNEFAEFEKSDTKDMFKDIDDIYKESQEKHKGRTPKSLKDESSHLHKSALVKNEIRWKKHDYYIVEKEYIVLGAPHTSRKSKINVGKEIIVVIETFKSDGTRNIERHSFILEHNLVFDGTPGLAEIAGYIISEYSLHPMDEINFFDFTCSAIEIPTKLYGLGQYNMNLLSSNRNKDGSATLTFGTISKNRSFELAFSDDKDDHGSPKTDSPHSESSMKVNTPGSRRSSLSSPKDSPAGHKSPYSPTVSGGPTIVVNVPEELVSYVSFTGDRHGGGRVRRKYTRRKQYTRKTRP